ncbi:hypothetical protein CCACVL1_26824 [Corchorus capsularis]|uniref:Uncharacterized protein n=1 Tax=Corchorus capsularis TaxID=210143 RepID=A0A1R3GD49_COCAP|nr:hypothetical protein CCACVL1_26824 [Corchorus capsularis]
MELQVEKTSLELDILKGNLKEYEVENTKEASLDEILHCEKNLKNSLQLITEKKNMLAKQYPSYGQGQTVVLQRHEGQASLAYNNAARNQEKTQGKKRSRAKVSTSNLPQLLPMPDNCDPRTWPYSLRVPNGASSSYAINPQAVAAYYPAGYPYVPSQSQIPPTYPPIQPYYWDPTAVSAQNVHPASMLGNPSMTQPQPIMGNSAMPSVINPYQQPVAYGTSTSCQPMRPNMMHQQLGGVGSSYAPQMMRENEIAPSIPNYQKPAGGFCDPFLDQSSMGKGKAPYVQLQQTGILGNQYKLGMLANDKPSGSGTQQNPTPSTPYHTYINSNAQKDASQQLRFGLNEVSLLSNSAFKTSTQNVASQTRVGLNGVNLLSNPTFTTTQSTITSQPQMSQLLRGGLNGMNLLSNSTVTTTTTQSTVSSQPQFSQLRVGPNGLLSNPTLKSTQNVASQTPMSQLRVGPNGVRLLIHPTVNTTQNIASQPQLRVGLNEANLLSNNPSLKSTQNVASQPAMSQQLEVGSNALTLLSKPAYNITQNVTLDPLRSQIQVDSNEVSFFSDSTLTTTQNLDVTTIMNSERAPSKSFFSDIDIGSIMNLTLKDGGNIDNGSNGGNMNSDVINIIGNPNGPTQENPPPMSPESFFLESFLNDVRTELNRLHVCNFTVNELLLAFYKESKNDFSCKQVEMENNTAESQAAENNEGNFMDWDDLTFPENFNFDDLDLLF